jgi:hypothetical protein
MTPKLLVWAAAVMLTGATCAEARPYSGSERPAWTRESAGGAARTMRSSRTYFGTMRRQSAAVGGRPAKWCGWWMRTQKGGGPEYNRAWSWSRWGRAAGPQVGAVVVWRHHVGVITGRAANGQWIVKSGNDGGRVRERPRSVAGAVFRI